MIDHVAEEPPWETGCTRHGQHPQHGVEDDVEQKQRLRHWRQSHQMRCERHDAGGHDKAEIGR